MAAPAEGALYSGDSLSWRISSQSFVLLGGPRAAILQVCDPGVAAGVAEYSRYQSDPWGRLAGTMDSMLKIAFGSEAVRTETLERLDRVHSAVKGKLTDGTEYSALEPERMFWVLATLTDTVFEVDRRYFGYMKRDDRVTYYEESKSIARAFGIPDEVIPADFDAFRAYFVDQIAKLEPTDASREVAETLLYPSMRYVPGFAWVPFSMITTELLPTRMRRKLRFRDLNPVELAAVRSAQVSARNSIAHVVGGRVPNPFAGGALAA